MQNISFSVSRLLLLIIMIYQVIPQLPICTKRKVVFLLHFPWKQDLVFTCCAWQWTFLTLPWHRWWTELTERGNKSRMLSRMRWSSSEHTRDWMTSVPLPRHSQCWEWAKWEPGPPCYGGSKSFLPQLRTQLAKDVLTYSSQTPDEKQAKGFRSLFFILLSKHEGPENTMT